MNHHQPLTQSVLSTRADCLVIGLYQDTPLSGTAKSVNRQSGELISRIIHDKDFSGQVGTTHLLHEVKGVDANRVMLVGLGENTSETTLQQRAKAYKKAQHAVGKALKNAVFTQVINTLPELADDTDWATLHGIITLERAMNTYPALRKTKEKPAPPKTIQWFGGRRKLSTAIDRGTAIAHGMEKMLLVANHPANICTPSNFAEFAKDFVKTLVKADKQLPLNVKVLKPDQLKKLGMNSFLGVAKGSDEPARLVDIVYRGSQYANNTKKARKPRPLVLVGKGVTFDSGGISLKPGAEMDHMKWDMCGAASVLGALLACAKMKLPIDVVGITPLCENLPSAKASKPSDVVTTMNGLTVENLNTDAEGRLILCDALTYAQKEYQPQTLIDVATLTGACVVALGDIRMGLYSNEETLGNALKKAGDTSLDGAWQMPTDAEYLEGMRSNFADLANISGRSGGSVTAAKFLEQFVNKDVDWAHLDIAGVAYKGNGADKGATGRPLPLIMQFLMDNAFGSTQKGNRS